MSLSVGRLARLGASSPRRLLASRFPGVPDRVARYRCALRTAPDWARVYPRALVSPRYAPGRIRLAGNEIEYPDLQSVMAQFHDIFRSRIYHFEAVHPAPRILDGGGYIGLSALYFKQAYPDARIDTFEPDPRLAAMIEGNLARNGISGVQVHNLALSGRAGVASYESDGADGGRLLDGAGPLKVHTTELSRFLTEPVDFLKLDIEGSELAVLQEAAERLVQVRELVIEYHAWPEAPQRLGRILDLLDESGFRYLLNHADYFVNPAVRPPFILRSDTRWQTLVYARRRDLI